MITPKTPKVFITKKDILENIKLDVTQESKYLDFKRKIDLSNKSKRNELATELSCDICQFANTLGGTILIGVEEGIGTISGLKVAKNFINVDNCEEIRVFINDKVRNCYYPANVEYEIVTIELSSSITVLAINVAPIIDAISCVFSVSSHDYLKYPYRTEFGKKYMRPHEVEENMNNKSRRIFLKLNKLWGKKKKVKVLSEIYREEKNPAVLWDHRDLNIVISDLYQNEMRMKINDKEINIPYGLIKEVWNTADDEIGIIIDAKIRVSADRKEVSISI